MKQVKSYAVVFVRDADGGYCVSVPDLDGCFTEGNSFEEAQANAKEAIEGFVASLIDRGLPVPEPSQVVAVPVEFDFPSSEVAA